MAIDVSGIQNNNKFDPVREALLELETLIAETGSAIGNGAITISTSGNLTGGGSFTLNQFGNSIITIGIDDASYLTSSDISDFLTQIDTDLLYLPLAGGTLTGDLNGTNLILSGYLRGPSTLVIDPAAHGNATGLVQILGDLRVDGTTTIINSTTINVSDKNITIAKDALTAGDANGAGITIAGANATLTYLSVSDDFTFNKVVNAAGFVGDLTGNADTADALSAARNIALDGSVTGNADFDGSGNITITTTTNHNHDDRYYTETESDSRFVNVSGDTMTGDLTLNYAYPRINLYDTNNDSDYSIINNDGAFSVYDITNNVHRFSISNAGNISVSNNLIVAGDLTLDDKLTITGTTNNFVIDEEADGTWHLYDTFQDNGIVLYSGSGGMDFQYNGVTEMTIDGSGVSFTGTINLDAADLNIGAADIIFDTVSGGAVRGLIWNVAGEGFLSKISSGGLESGKVTIYTNIGTTTIGSTFEIYGANGLGLSLSNSGILTAGGGTSTQWNTAYTYSQVGHLPLAGGTLTGALDLAGDLYYEGTGNYALDLNNSDIIGLNSLYFNDNAENSGEGLNFTNSATGNWSTLRASNGILYFAPDRASTVGVDGSVILHSTNFTNYTDPKYLRSDESDTMTGSLTINASGVGLNVSSSQNTGLIVDGGTNSGIISEFKYGTTKAAINTSGGGYFLGSIGIGVTSAATKLDVQTSNTGTGLGDGMILKLKNTSTTNNTRSGIVFGNIDSVGGALAMQSAILKNSVTGEYDMTWDLYGGVAGWKEALLYLDSNPGYVGIGTTSPSTKLDVSGVITANGINLSGVANPEITFNGSGDAGVDMAIKATPEGLDFYEPEDTNKIHFQILDDLGVNSPFGYQWNGQSLDSRYLRKDESTRGVGLTIAPTTTNGNGKIRTLFNAGSPALEFSDNAGTTGADQFFAIGANDVDTGKFDIRFRATEFGSAWSEEGTLLAEFKADNNAVSFPQGLVGIGTTDFGTTAAKLLVGPAIDNGSSAVAQFDGFLRIKDQIIIHDPSYTTAQGTLGYNSTNGMYYIGAGGGNYFGIGTTTPSQKLSVEGGSIKLNHDNAAANYYLWLNKKEDQDGGILMSRDNTLDWQIVNVGTSGDLMAYAYGPNTVAMTIKRSNAYFGIGTTDPGKKLHVAGEALIDGGVGVASSGTFHVRQKGDTSADGIALTSAHATSHRIWKDANGKLNFGPSGLPSAFVQDLSGNVSFGVPGNGGGAGGRFISIEGNTDGDGEGSGRIFFAENNTVPEQIDSYGFSIGYRGGATSVVGASGNTWNGLADIGNGQWGFWGHNNSANGAVVMYGDRAATYVNLANNDLNNVGNGYYNGSLGIGTTNPSRKLTIADGTGGGDPTDSRTKLYIDANTESYISLNVPANSYEGIRMAIAGTNKSSLEYWDNTTAGKRLWISTVSSDPIVLATTNIERVRITSNGKVGIGRGDDISYILDVKGGTNDTARFVAGFGDALVRIIGGNYATETDARLFIGENDTLGMTFEYDGVQNYGHIGMNDSVDPTGAFSKRISFPRNGSYTLFNAGNVGINTTTPEQKLHVEGTIQLGNQNDLAWAYDNGSYYNYITNNYTTTDGMIFRSGQWTSSQGIITHSFETWSGGWQKRLVIDQGGNVGIGINSPSYKLHVKGSGNYDGAVAIDNSTTTGGGSLVIRQNGVTSGFISVLGSAQGNSSRDLTYYADAGLGHYFYVNDGTMAMRVTSGGRVGIGLTNPSGILQINGAHPGGYGLLRLAGTGATIIDMDGQDTWDVRLRYKRNGTDYWFLGMLDSSVFRLTDASNVTKLSVTQAGDTYISNRLSVATTNFGTTAAKFLVGDFLSNGSSAIAQFDGFLRIKDQIIIHNAGNTSLEGYLQCTAAGTITTGGTFRALGDVIAYASSDRELKDNITPIPNALEKVKAIGGYEFDWNDKQDTHEGHDIGVIAQEVEAVLPEIVTTRENGYKAVKYEKLVAVLIEAVKDQQKQIDELKALLNGITK